MASFMFVAHGRVVNHTSHTRDYSYIVLATYATDEQLESIEEMFDGIEVVPQKWTQRIWRLFGIMAATIDPYVIREGMADGI